MPRDDGYVLAEQDQFEGGSANALLAVDVVRRIHPHDELAGPEDPLIEDFEVPLVVVMPVAIAVAPADHARHAPRVVVVHGSLFGG